MSKGRMAIKHSAERFPDSYRIELLRGSGMLVPASVRLSAEHRIANLVMRISTAPEGVKPWQAEHELKALAQLLDAYIALTEPSASSDSSPPSP